MQEMGKELIDIQQNHGLEKLRCVLTAMCEVRFDAKAFRETVWRIEDCKRKLAKHARGIIG